MSVREGDNFAALPWSEDWSAGSSLYANCEQPDGNVSDDHSGLPAHETETSKMPTASISNEGAGTTDEKTSPGGSPVNSPTREGSAAAEHQQQEDPRFIQVGEKVTFLTVVEAVLIPSNGDTTQEDKNQIWWQGRDYIEFRKNYARFLRTPSREDDPDWEEVPNTSAPAVDVIPHKTVERDDDPARVMTPTAGAVLVVDATTAVPTAITTATSVPVSSPLHLPYNGNSHVVGKPVARAERPFRGKMDKNPYVKTVGRENKVPPSKSYGNGHSGHYFKNDQVYQPEYVVGHHQGGRFRGRGIGWQHAGQQHTWHSHCPSAHVRGHASSLAAPVAITRSHGQFGHGQRVGRRRRLDGAAAAQAGFPVHPYAEYNHMNGDRQRYGGVVFGYGPPTVVMNRYGVDYGYLPHGTTVMAPHSGAGPEVHMPQPPRYCMWRGPAIFPDPVVPTMQ